MNLFVQLGSLGPALLLGTLLLDVELLGNGWAGVRLVVLKGSLEAVLYTLSLGLTVSKVQGS